MIWFKNFPLQYGAKSFIPDGEPQLDEQNLIRGLRPEVVRGYSEFEKNNNKNESKKMKILCNHLVFIRVIARTTAFKPGIGPRMDEVLIFPAEFLVL